MKKSYTLNLKYETDVDLWGAFSKVYVHSAKIGLKRNSVRLREPANGAQYLVATTKEGAVITMSKYEITLGFLLPSPDPALDMGVGLIGSLQKAAALEKLTGKIDPNIASLGMGKFGSNQDFLNDFGALAAKFQQGMYLGGHAFFYPASGDYQLVLGHTPKVETIHSSGIKDGTILRIENTGQSQTAESIDEVIERLIKTAS